MLSLAFHVDYWNRLGWRDGFSDPAYSERQRWYAVHRPEPRVYTPQMVVQGTHEFIGSHLDEARKAISAALSQPARVSVSLEANTAGDDGWQLRYEVEGADRADFLNLALLHQQAATEVKAGENAGETLHHVSVVIDYAQKRVESGKGSWAASGASGMEATSAVAFVQDQRSLSVLGGSRLNL